MPPHHLDDPEQPTGQQPALLVQAVWDDQSGVLIEPKRPSAPTESVAYRIDTVTAKEQAPEAPRRTPVDATLRMSAKELKDAHQRVESRGHGWGWIALAGLLGLALGVGASALFFSGADRTEAARKETGSTAAPKPPVALWPKYPPLPDPELTPGEAGKPQISHPIPGLAQKAALAAYRIAPGSSLTVVSRLIPPELGGTDDPRNLFPLSAADAEFKLRLDKQLTNEVAAAVITVDQAVKALQDDWVAVARRHNVPKSLPPPAPVAKPASVKAASAVVRRSGSARASRYRSSSRTHRSYRRSYRRGYHRTSSTRRWRRARH